MADDTGVGIRLLGGFEATVGGRLVPAGAWRLRKARTLVKLLVLADGHRMHRESLVALLWPDRDTASGINNLHQALYVARRVLAPGFRRSLPPARGDRLRESLTREFAADPEPATRRLYRDLLTAAALSSGLAEDPAVALRLAVSLWRFWLARGDFSEASRWLAATLAAAPERTASRARALLAASAIEVRRGDPATRQIDLGIEAVAIMRAAGDDRALAQTLHLTGLLAWVSDHGWQRAAGLVREARTLATAAGDAGGVASATHTLGVIAVSRGAGPQAEEHFEQVLGVLEGLPPDLPPFFFAVTPGCFWEIGPGGLPRLPFTETVLLFRRAGTEQAAAEPLLSGR